MDKLTREIRALIGTNHAMVEAFRDVVIGIHRERESTVARRNRAIVEVFDQFMGSDMDYVLVVKRLRGGADPGNVKRFDEMCEYAAREFPDVLSRVHGESEAGTPEESFGRLMEEGVRPLPKPWDDEILQSALEFVGPSFTESFQSPSPQVNAQPPAQTDRRIRSLLKYNDLITQDINSENNGGKKEGWPQYRLKRMHNAIANLPADLQGEAIRRSGYQTLREIVEAHVGRAIQFSKDLAWSSEPQVNSVVPF